MAGQRRNRIVEAASKLFIAKGYDATTIRDIADATGILGGSLYYYFSSKEDIYHAVLAGRVEAAIKAVTEAIADKSDPWDRLEAAAIAHCEVELANVETARIVTPYFPVSIGEFRPKLVAERDRYESIIAGLVEALDLAPDLDRRIFRLHFLGALNWVPTWYRRQRELTPEDIARQLIAMFRARQSCAN